MTRASIRVRLTLWYSAVLLFGLLLLAGGRWFMIGHRLTAAVDARLLERAEGLRTVIEIERRSQERGLSLQIIPPPEHVRAVFRLSGTEQELRFTGQPAQGSPPLDYAERVELELAVRESAPGEERAEVRKATAGKLSRADSEVAVLLTSELVTNAVVHPTPRVHDSIGLRISADSGRARVEVADSGRGFDPTTPRKDKAVGGRGLLIVERGAVRWGASRGDRFRVWFELP